MSTYSSNLRVELITSGDQPGVWGNTTNDNFAYVFDQAIAGSQAVTVVSSSHVLTYTNGPTSTAANNQSIYSALRINTATGADFAVYAPPNPKSYILTNSSSYNMTIYNSTVIGNTTAAGTGVTLNAGQTLLVYSDGTNFLALRNIPRVVSVASSTTPTPNANTTDQYELTALAAPATFGSPTGTPLDGQKLIIRFKDDGTARALTWTTGSSGSYRPCGVDLPTTTIATKTSYVGFVYNSAAARWDAVAAADEA